MVKVGRLLLLGFAGVGDTLLATPTLRLLRGSLPDAHITALTTSSGSKDVLENNPDLSELIFVEGVWKKPKMLFKTMWEIRQRKFDVVVTVYPTSRLLFNAMSFFSGAPERIIHEYPKDFFRKLCFLQNVRVPIMEGEHNVVQNINLLRPLGIKPKKKDRVRIILNVSEESKRLLLENGIKSTDLLVGLHAGSGGMSYKRWPLPKFLSLAKRLSTELEAKTIFFCGPYEKDIAGEVGSRGFLVFECSSLGETAALIGECDLFVSNDSSLMHVAVSQDVPVVGVFGPTDPNKTGPYTNKKAIVKSRLPCSPCYSPTVHRKFKCKYGYSKCLEELSVDDVFKTVKSIL